MPPIRYPSFNSNPWSSCSAAADPWNSAVSRRQCGAVEGEEGACSPCGAGARDQNCTHTTRQSLPQVKRTYTDIKVNNQPLPGSQTWGCRCASPPLPLLHRLPACPVAQCAKRSCCLRQSLAPASAGRER